jgi:hypothetical protein
MTAKKTTTKKSVALVVPDEEKAIAPIQEASKFMMSKTWLEEKQVLKILQRTPAEHRFMRKGKGGGDFEYVTGVYIQKVLNYVFGWNWDFEIVKQELIGDVSDSYAQIITTGRLTVKSKDGQSVSKMQNGRADVKHLKSNPKQPLDLGNDYKASATDCFKKCASMFGIASDVYGKNEFKEIKQTVNEPVKIVREVERVMGLIERENEVDGLEAYKIITNKDKNLTDSEKNVIITAITNKITALNENIKKS